MKDTPTNHSSNLHEDIDKDVQDFQKYKEEHEAQQKKELAEDIQKFEERPRPPWYQDPMALSMQGDITTTQITDSTPDTKLVKEVWEDRGIIDVPVAKLPDPDNIKSPEDFDHHITWKDAQEATLKLPEVQQQVNAGNTRDDFSAEDKINNIDPMHGKTRIYDLYYGSDPVTVDKDGEDYSIEKGRHRIFAAKTLGLETIPARVKEKVGE
jgi:hypothetical protein